MNDVEKHIGETWFSEHIATLTQHRDLQVLQWEKPGTNTYSCRYVFDGNKMYISGDIGEAVFWLTWKADIHSFNDIHVGYFEEKLTAYSGQRRDYDGTKARQQLEDWRIELIEEEVPFDIDTFREMISAAESCSSKEEWALNCVNDEYSEFISELEADYWEWIYNIGDKMPRRIIGYLVGLKMASKQLKEKSVVA
ncbi:hypothetical protein [Metabacillus fastidiosus]|uniref:hypothetical protein n=1 Tax=Metabacillus fastidiosus TaxID=1458 RepID=UPI002E1C8905|nr:hypothetical protein [Metabacillus fastidiosus]